MVATPERRTQCVRIVPKNGDPIRIAVAYPVDLKMSNDTVYKGGIYSQPTAISAVISGAATVLDFGSVYDADAITRDQIQSGYWDGVKVFSFFTDWANPVEDEEEDRAYFFGKINEEDERYTVEVMSQMDMLNQTSGRQITPGCQWVLGDGRVTGELIASDRSRCKIDLETLIFESTVGSVINSLQFVGADLDGDFVDDYFGFGEIVFTSGANSGLGYRLVRAYLANGTITISEPFYYPVDVGDSFKIKAGCRKRFKEDCIDKFDNGVRFGAFPHVPQRSTVYKFGDQ